MLQTLASWGSNVLNVTQVVLDTIKAHDPHTRGIVILGLGESEDILAESFAIAARYPLVKGFAVGRTIFEDAATGWMAGTLSDEEAVAQMSANYQRLCNIWDQARAHYHR